MYIYVYIIVRLNQKTTTTMIQEIINGLECWNNGSNNYSYGMEAIMFDAKKYTIDDIKSINGVFLLPSLEPDGYEIYALKGNEEQFSKFYKACRDHDVSVILNNEFDYSNMDINIYRNRRKELMEEWKAWYE